MRYTDESCTVIDAGDGRMIPCDPENTDYAKIIADGTYIAPAITQQTE